jgi:uncharacterized membrane protein YccC
MTMRRHTTVVARPSRPVRLSPLVPPTTGLVKPLFVQRPGWHHGHGMVTVLTLLITVVITWRLFDARSAIMAVSGALVVMFARHEPYLHRARTVAGFGLLIIAAAAVGTVIAGSTWGLVAFIAVLAGIAGYATETMRTPVPGPALLLIPPSIVFGVPPHGLGQIAPRVSVVAIGVGVALVVTLLPWVFRRHEPEQQALITAFRAVADAYAALDTDRFDGARAAASAAVHKAFADLRLGDALIGGQRATMRRLWALAHHASWLSLHAEVLAAEHIPRLPSQVTDAVRRIAMSVTDPTAAAGFDIGIRPKSTSPVALHALYGEIVATLDTAADPLAVGSPVVRTSHWPSLRAALRPRTAALNTVLRLTVLNLVTDVVAVSIGLDRWYWSGVCVVAAAWGSHTWHSWYRSAQRGLATVAGSVVGFGLLMARPSFLVSLAIIMVVFYVAELYFPRNYGFAMAVVTPMVLVMIAAAAQPVVVDAEALALDRTETTLLGCLIGVIGAFVLWPTSNTTLLGRGLADALHALHDLIRAYSQKPATGGRSMLRNAPEWESLRRRVRGTLVGLDKLANDALGEALGRRAAEALWPAVIAVQRTGYLLLAAPAEQYAVPLRSRTLQHWEDALADLADAAIRHRDPADIAISPEWGHPGLHTELQALRTTLYAAAERRRRHSASAM